MAPRLTVVLPLKGRHLFTLRFLWHANKLRLPYRFLIADGQVNEAVARHLENSREIFPEIDVEYVRYPDDTDYGRYFAKVSDALSRVRTPYAMVADNDDFLGLDGIERALDFLEANADYVCARGRPIAFSVYSGLGNPDGGVYGSFNRFRTSYESKDVSSPVVTERLRQAGLSHLIFYAVYRTEVLSTIWREVTEIDVSDVMLWETFHAMRPLTLGKVRTNKATITYLWQDGTSLSSNPSRDWVRHFLRSHLTSNIHDVVKRISSAAAAADGVDEVIVAEQVRALIESYFRDFLRINYGFVAQIKRTIRRKWPTLVKYLRSRPRFLVVRERAALLSKLANAGASGEDIKRMRGELAAIEGALSRQAFAEFAGPFMAIARADDSRNWI